MGKRISSRAIIIEDDKVLLMYRRKLKEDGILREYYAIPGGGKEENETLHENVIREIKEEFSIDVEVLGYLGKEEDDTSITHFFHCKKINGEPKLGGLELERNNPNNYYEIRYVDLKEINNINISYQNIIEKAYRKEYNNSLDF